MNVSLALSIATCRFNDISFQTRKIDRAGEEKICLHQANSLSISLPLARAPRSRVFFMPSSFVPAARRCTREEARTCKLRSELISVEDKRNESERENTRDGEKEPEKHKQTEREKHVAVPRSTAHNVRKRFGEREHRRVKERERERGAPTPVRHVG